MSLKIVKTEIADRDYSFLVRIRGEALMNAEMIVEGRKQMEQLMRMVGKWAHIHGIHDLTTSFKKIGEGSFANVYEAVTNYQHRFALKCF